MQLPIDSNVVEVVTALIFDVLLIGAIELLCQAICSNYNLHQVYDTPRALTLRSRRFAMFGDGLIGIPWLSSLFTAVLALCVASNITIGFSVNGRSASVFRTANYATMVTVMDPPELLQVDYTKEFAILDTFQGNSTDMTEEKDENDEEGRRRRHKRRPEYLSKRLVALQKNDWCQVCNFTHCNIVSYAYRSEVLESSLVNATDLFEHGVATCVSARNFRDEMIMATSERLNQNTASCKFKSLSVVSNSTNSTFDDNAEQSGTLIASDDEVSYEFDYCHYDVTHMSCYSRPGHATRCAAIAKLLPQYVRTSDEERQLSLIVVKDIGTPDNGMDISRISLSLSYNLTMDYDMRQYTSTVAFLSAIDVAPTFILELIPFVSFLYDVPLRERSEKEQNVADVDLRLAVPCVMFVVMAALVLAMTAGATWTMFVWRKKRQNFNSFATIPDLLELLVEQQRMMHYTGSVDDDEEHVEGNEMKRHGQLHMGSPTLTKLMQKSEEIDGGFAASYGKEKVVVVGVQEKGKEEDGSSKCKRTTETTVTNTTTTGTGSMASTHEVPSCSPRSRHGSNAQWRKRRGRGRRISGSGTDGPNSANSVGVNSGSCPGSGSGIGSRNVGDTGRRRKNMPCVYVAGHDPTVLRVRRGFNWEEDDEGDDADRHTEAEQQGQSEEDEEDEDIGDVAGGGGGGGGNGAEQRDRGEGEGGGE